MRKIYAFCAFFLIAGCLPSAEMWTGQLFDATCVEHRKEPHQYEDCKPADRTVSFILETAGQRLKLDANGDKMAAAAWRDYTDSADRSTDPGAGHAALTAVIQGAVNGDQIKVYAILLR